MRLSEIGKQANKTSREKGFWEDYDRIPQLLFLVKDPGHTFGVEFYGDNKVSSNWQEAYKEAEIAKKICLIHSELSEVLEARRKGIKANRIAFERVVKDSTYKDDPQYWKEMFEKFIKDSDGDEFADAQIMLAELAEELKMDLEWHVQMKMMYNALREPKHGKKF